MRPSSFCIRMLGWNVILAIAFSPGQLDAQDPKSTSEPQYQKIVVPTGNLSDFKPDNWLPVSIEDFKALLGSGNTKSDPAEMCVINRSVFSAKLRDEHALEGEFVFTVQRRGKGEQFLTLTPCSIPLNNLSWRDRPVTWGTTGSGEGIVIVDRDAGELVGKWDLAANTRRGGAEFSVEVPQASLTTFEFLLPNEFELKVTDPPVTVQSSPSDHENQSWKVAIGGRNVLHFGINRRETDLKRDSVILCQQEDSHSIRRDGTRLRTKIQLNPSGGGVDELSLRVDPKLQILTVTLDDDLPLIWSEKQNDSDERFINLKFPERIVQPGRMLLIQAFEASEINEPWTLSSIDILGGIIERRVIALQIDAPLELRSIAHRNCRQVGIDTGTPVTRTFLADGKAPKLEVLVGDPKLRSACTVSAQVRCDPEYWTAEFELEFQASSGSEFELPMRIQSGWEIVDVHTGSPALPSSEEPLHWDVSDRPDRSQQLNIELQDALRPSAPRTISIRIRRPAPKVGQSVEIPAVVPLIPVTQLSLLLRLLHDRQSTAILEPGSSFEVVSPEYLSESGNQRMFFQNRPLHDNLQPFVLRLKDEEVSGDVFVRSALTKFSGSTKISTEFSNDRVDERILLNIIPQANLDRVLIHLPDSGEEFNWTAGNSSLFTVDAVRLPRNRHAVWGAPPHGELWDLNLSRSLSTPFELHGRRTIPKDLQGKIILPRLPQSETYEGEVRITASDTNLPELELSSGESILFELPDAGSNLPGTREAVWKYVSSDQEDPSKEIIYRFPRGTGDTTTNSAASVRVNFRAGRNDIENDLYEIEYHFDFPVLVSQMSLEIPQKTQFCECLIDGLPAEFSRQDTVSTLFSSSRTQGTLLTIRYGYETNGSHSRHLVFPKTIFPISEVDWNIFLAEGTTLSRWPEFRESSDEATPGHLGKMWTPALLLFNFPELARPSGGGRPDLKAVTFRSYSMPDQLDIKLLDTKAILPYVWLSLFIGMGIRLLTRRWTFFQKFTGIVPTLLALLFLSWMWGPESISPIVQAGFIGFLLGTFLPRWWIPRKLEETTANQQGDVVLDTTRFVTTSGLILFFTLCSTTPSPCDAQEPVTPSSSLPANALNQLSNPSHSGGLRVLIPMNDPEDPNEQPSQIYLSPEWKPWISRTESSREDSESPLYLFRSVEHTLDLSDPANKSYHSTIEIELDETSHIEELRIPVSNVRFGGAQSCLLDGKPRPMFGIPGEKAVRIPLELKGSGESGSDTPDREGLRTKRIVLQLNGFPVIDSSSSTWKWDSEIPRSIDSVLTLKFDRPTDHFEVVSAFGSPVWDSDRRGLRVHLGAISHLVCKQSDGKPESLELPQVEVDAIGIVDIGLGTLDFDYRLKMLSPPTDMPILPLRLPLEAIVREVSVDGNPLSPSISSSKNGLLLQCVVPEKLSNPAVWKISFQVPRKDSGDGLRIPAIEWLTTDKTQGFRIGKHLLALRTPPNLTVTGPLDSKEQSTLIDIDPFLSQWGNVPVRPQLGLDIKSPTPLAFKLSPVSRTSKIVENELQISMDLNRVDFEWNFSIDNREGAPRFEYEFQVPESLQIDSLSVVEDEANRLLHWSRREDRLYVFLREQTSGIQRLRLKARIPIRIPSQLTIPEIQLAESTSVAQKVLIFVNPQVAVEWLDPASIEEPDDSGRMDLNSVGKVRIGTWLFPAKSNSPRNLRVLVNNSQMSVDTACIITRQSNVWELRTHLLFRVSEGYATNFRVHIPASIHTPRIVSPGSAQHFEELASNSGTSVTFTPQSAVSDTFHVEVTSEIPVPQSAYWIVPRVTTPDVSAHRNFIIVNPRDLVNEVDLADSGIRLSSLIPELEDIIPKSETTDSKVFEFYRGDDVWTLPVRNSARITGSESPTYAEDHLHVKKGREIVGRLSLIIARPAEEKVEFRLPKPVALTRMLVNGRVIDPQKTADGYLAKLTGGTDLFKIEIDWFQERADRTPLPISFNYLLPEVIYPSITDRFAVLHLPPESRSMGVVEGDPVNWWDFAAIRAERLAAFSVPLAFGGEEGSTLASQLEFVEEKWGRAEQSSDSRGDHQIFKKVLEQLKSRKTGSFPDDSVARIHLNYPDPESVTIFQVHPGMAQIGVRLVSKNLLRGLATLVGLMLCIFLLPRIPLKRINDFADRSPPLGWLSCGIVLFFSGLPIWLAASFAIPAAFAWNYHRNTRVNPDDLFLDSGGASSVSKNL